MTELDIWNLFFSTKCSGGLSVCFLLFLALLIIAVASKDDPFSEFPAVWLVLPESLPQQRHQSGCAANFGLQVMRENRMAVSTLNPNQCAVSSHRRMLLASTSWTKSSLGDAGGLIPAIECDAMVPISRVKPVTTMAGCER